MKLPLAVALLVVVVVALDPGGQLANFERRTLDARYRHAARTTAFTERIVILDISEESLERLRPLYGRWPWPRSVHGEVAEYLAQDGATAIGFDLLFAEPVMRQEVESTLLTELSALAQSADLPEVRAELTRRIDALQPGLGDQQFVDSVAKAGNVFQAAVLAPGDPTQPAVLPFPELARAARGIGHINAMPDADGSYRHFAPLLGAGDARVVYPSLAVAIAAYVKGVPLAALRREADGLTIGDVLLPTLADGSAWIHYQGGSIERKADGRETFQSFYQHVPFEAVLASKDLLSEGKPTPLARGLFRDKIVLVSAQAAGLSDLRASPFSPVMPGIEIHANIIDSILSGRFLRAPGAIWEFWLLLAVCVPIALLASKARLALGLSIALGTAASATGVSWLAFGHGWLLPIVKPVLAIALCYGGAVLLRTVIAERDKRWLRTAFGHYLAPTVLDEVLRHPEDLRLGGQRRHLTVLFSDVADFTAFSEKLAPEAVGALLNDYLDRMTACVAQTGGTLDKFVGDAVMAEWNAPQLQTDHAARACETALLMLQAVRQHSAAWTSICGGAFDIRIGVNTGEVIVGNMGSHQIFDYTVIGNEVNTASRLEPLNKGFGTHIIVADATRREAEALRPGHFAFRPLASVMPKGRTEPLLIHELLGWRATLDEAACQDLDRYEQAMGHYLNRRFNEAGRLFQAVLDRQPGDGPATLFARLSQEFITQPPPPQWDATYLQTQK